LFRLGAVVYQLPARLDASKACSGLKLASINRALTRIERQKDPLLAERQSIVGGKETPEETKRLAALILAARANEADMTPEAAKAIMAEHEAKRAVKVA
jgi:hypothetical protein